MKKTWIVIVGKLAYGISTVHGPFEHEGLADQWASTNVGKQEHYILPMTRPKPKRSEHDV